MPFPNNVPNTRTQILESTRFKDAKDPCICFDGTTWHIYGSGGTTITEEWNILHATAPSLEGPWTEIEPVTLIGLSGIHVAAPSVIYDDRDGLYHMAVQKDFTTIGTGVEYLVSADGQRFTWVKTILDPISETEAGLYDPHLSVINGEKCLVYAAMPSVMPDGRPFTPQPDAYLAKSESGLWAGPWIRVGKILDHESIAWHHNRRESPDYEWGIEGPQIVELPDGGVLMNATCFIEEGPRGTRQRVFFALADSVEGPYNSIGPVLDARDQPWESGENGHASAIVQGDKLYLFYQARPAHDPVPVQNNWSYGIAVFPIADIKKALRKEEVATEYEESKS